MDNQKNLLLAVVFSLIILIGFDFFFGPNKNVVNENTPIDRVRLIDEFGDVLFSLLVLGIGSPVFVLIAVLVKLSSKGPVFYVQRRVGRDYKRFGCIKFRTMREMQMRFFQMYWDFPAFS